MEKQQAIQKLEKQRSKIDELKFLKNDIFSPEFKQWMFDTERAIQKIFGVDSIEFQKFTGINYDQYFLFETLPPSSQNSEAYKHGLDTAFLILTSFIDEFNEHWDDAIKPVFAASFSALEQIELLCNRFHNVARQLRHRHSNRTMLEIADEYDVQDLFHSLLTLYFDDIRDEEWTPSYAGACSRVDFLLKQENIVIELKKTRKGLARKEIGDQLFIDIQRYKAHPNCKNLICFVYDPETMISNPKGLENDLTKVSDGLDVRVFIRSN